jgi:uncharacterized protein YgiM (DUF1202 family)
MKSSRLSKTQWISLTVLTLLSTTTFGKTNKIAYICADIANIRQEPTSSASIVGRIKINEQVSVRKENDGWMFVAYYGDSSIGYLQDTAIVEGWMSGTLLSSTLISKKVLSDSVATASSPVLKKNGLTGWLWHSPKTLPTGTFF